MGMGKSLTALSVLWSFVRSQSVKALIVCPSSLIDNWTKEFKKWLGTHASMLLIVRYGMVVSEIIERFR
jgi:DNA repair and recombination protein RAD54B